MGGCSQVRFSQRRTAGFSLLELLVVVATLAILAGLLLPVLSSGKESGRRVTCASSLRQLYLALHLYADDHDDFFPAHQPGRHWPAQLEPYYRASDLLLCPSDFGTKANPTAGLSAADQAARSYLLNGFGQPDARDLAGEHWLTFISGPSHGSIKASSLQHPAETISLGEKMSASWAFTADLHRQSGSFLEVVELSRHKAGTSSGGPSAKAGGSNHAFADGSVRWLKRGEVLCPVNLWGVTDYYRTNYAVCLF